MTVDMHALLPWTGGPSSSEAAGAPDSDEWSYPFYWHLAAPDVDEDEDEAGVGTLFNAPEHLDTAQTLLDAAEPELGARLRAALWDNPREGGVIRWSGEALRAVVDALSQIPELNELGGAVPDLDDGTVERLAERLPLDRFYTPAPVTLEQKREALSLWIHNAGVVGAFFAKAMKHGCDVVY